MNVTTDQGVSAMPTQLTTAQLTEKIDALEAELAAIRGVKQGQKELLDAITRITRLAEETREAKLTLIREVMALPSHRRPPTEAIAAAVGISRAALYQAPIRPDARKSSRKTAEAK